MHHWDEISGIDSERQLITTLLWICKFAFNASLADEEKEMLRKMTGKSTTIPCAKKMVANLRKGQLDRLKSLLQFENFGKLYGRLKINSIAIHDSEWKKIGGGM